MTKGIVTIDGGNGRNVNALIIGVTSAIESASGASALSGFRLAWGTSGELLVHDELNDIAVAAASSDLAMVGRLLGPRDVNTVCFNERELPESLVRRPSECSLLDVAVGSGSVEMTKYLFEFHGAKATRETLKQSISAGNLGMFRMVRERLSEGELRDRVDLMEVASEFHQEEVLAWLHRDATVLERELLGVFALERKVADSLVVAFEGGFHPWWGRTRGVSLKWRASSETEFVSAPRGFWSDGGWWTAVSGATSALRGLGNEARLGPTLPAGRPRVRSAARFEWTKEMSRAQMGTASLVKSVVFPSIVIAIGKEALRKFEALESVVFPAGCVDIAYLAFAHCTALKTVSLPFGCKATGDDAFVECSSLVSVTIPVGCSTISRGCFSCCTSLTEMGFPKGLKLVGECAFFWSALKEVALPDGCAVAMCAFWECRALTKVMIGSGCRSIGACAFEACRALTSVTIGGNCASIGPNAFQNCGALTTVTIGDGLKSIGKSAFINCTRLTSVALSSSVQSIGQGGFKGCTSLAAIAVPKGCQLHSDAFRGCSPQVTRF
jgi:hypothetical protein